MLDGLGAGVKTTFLRHASFLGFARREKRVNPSGTNFSGRDAEKYCFVGFAKYSSRGGFLARGSRVSPR